MIEGYCIVNKEYYKYIDLMVKFVTFYSCITMLKKINTNFKETDMKLIICSIFCGFLGLSVANPILSIGGQVGDFGIILFGVIVFFSPGLYVLNKLYEKSKKENIKE